MEVLLCIIAGFILHTNFILSDIRKELKKLNNGRENTPSCIRYD